MAPRGLARTRWNDSVYVEQIELNVIHSFIIHSFIELIGPVASVFIIIHFFVQEKADAMLECERRRAEEIRQLNETHQKVSYG